MVFLDATDETEYKLDLDEATYKYNAEDNELSDLSHYSRESGYNGILGKWICHVGESFKTGGYGHLWSLFIFYPLAYNLYYRI